MAWTPARKRRVAKRTFNYGFLALLLIWPWYGDTFVYLGDAAVAIAFAIIAASLVLLTGWVGQISLAQASFVGVGAFATSLVARSLHVGFPLNMVVAGFAAAAAAALLGLVALRVRGLYLAVATLIFAWMCDTYLFLSPWLTGGGGAVSVQRLPVGTEGAFPYFDLTNRRTFYYVGLALVAAVVFGLTNLRDSKTGRALFAVKGSEVAAASLGVDVTRYKLLAFALSGFIAGMAGNLIAVYQGTLTPAQFRFTQSFFFLAIPVVGGLQSLSGAVAAAVLFGVLADLFYKIVAFNGYLEIVSAVLLMVVLLVYPGGLAAVPATVGRLWNRWRSRAMRPAAVEPVEPVEPVDAPADDVLASDAPDVTARVPRTPPWRARLVRSRPVQAELLPLSALGFVEPEPAPEPEPVVAADDAADDAPSLPAWMMRDGRVLRRARAVRLQRTEESPVLEAKGIVVAFGGLVAVNDVSLSVRRGEIVGLIGPNGAGKTTLFNAIAGLNHPTSGTVEIFGQDATALPVHARASLGVGRTFQAIQLLTELTVFDNLLVATHLQNPTGFLSHIAVTRSSLVAEHQSRALVRRVVELLGLEDVAGRRVAGLPFGTLRMVEVARALATRSPLIMLDEPASGLDNAETDRLSQLLFFLRDELGVSILLIEHDVNMVTSVCDYVHVIDRGNLIAEGATDEVQRDPKVIAAYLGEAPTEAAADDAGQPLEPVAGSVS
jgi:ABC-type branched-subunit amino acid transport system ATPase component/ABC-type branched-subunit amino acid transport system permease subunit